MSTANEGGAWGVALLAAYLTQKEEGETLEHYLEEKIFRNLSDSVIEATPEEMEGFETFIERYKKGLSIEKAAIAAMDWE